jgi:hypothetical protein
LGPSKKLQAAKTWFSSARDADEQIGPLHRQQAGNLGIEGVETDNDPQAPISSLQDVECRARGDQALLVGGQVEFVLVANDLTGNVKEVRTVLDGVCFLIVEEYAPSHNRCAVFSGQPAKDVNVGIEQLVAPLAQEALEAAPEATPHGAPGRACQASHAPGKDACGRTLALVVALDETALESRDQRRREHHPRLLWKDGQLGRLGLGLAQEATGCGLEFLVGGWDAHPLLD